MTKTGAVARSIIRALDLGGHWFLVLGHSIRKNREVIIRPALTKIAREHQPAGERGKTLADAWARG